MVQLSTSATMPWDAAGTAEAAFTRFRHYDPSTARFLTQDAFAGSSADPLSLHKYLYANANPVMYSDPTGMFGIPGFLMGFSIATSLRQISMPVYTGIYEGVEASVVGMQMGWSLNQTLLIYGLSELAGFGLGYVIGKATDFILTAKGRLTGNWAEVTEYMSARARSYQTQVTGRNGQAFILNGVKFDGVLKNKILVDAKGPGYAQFVKNGTFTEWFTGKHAILEQAKNQIEAAAGARIEWHIAEQEAIPAFQALLARADITEITLIHTPVIP